jgi:hypothetical protein
MIGVNELLKNGSALSTSGAGQKSQNWLAKAK